MQGLMSSYPLTLTHVFHRAERIFPEKGIATVERRRDRADDLRRVGRAHAPARGRARHARDLRRRPRRHVRLEHRAPPRALLRRAVQRPRPAHAEHPPVPGRHRLHRQPRRGRGRLRRPLAAEALLAAGRPLRDRQARRRDGRRRRRRDPRRPARARLRGAAGGRRAGRVPVDRRREPGRRHVLHERHDRPPEGRRLLAPLDRPALDGRAGRRRRRGLRARHDHAGRADVPRQRVGPLPGRGDGRRLAGDARPEHAAEGARGADGVREGHARRRRADDLDGRPARAQGPRPVRRCARSCAAARPCRARSRRPTASRSGCRSCRPGG